MQEQRKQRRCKWRIRPWRFIAAVGCCALIVAAVMLISDALGYRHNREIYDNVIEIAVATPAPQDTGADGLPQAPPITVDFPALQSAAPNVAAWLYAEDTVISYPAMLCGDNEYYLTHAWDGQESVGGALFFDRRHTSLDTDDNLILYGHNMKDGSMFAALNGYREQAFYDAHPMLWLLTPDGAYKVVLFAARVVPTEIEYYPVSFAAPEDREAYIAQAMAQSFFTYAGEQYPAARILTLSTCSHEHENSDPKLLLHGWVIPE